jgi:hypothetical protein
MLITFADWRPPARYPPIVDPWTTVEIQEAAGEAGPWTTIATIALSPVDGDPTNPAARSFSTEAATLPNGWYQLRFKDVANDASDWLPAGTAPNLGAVPPTLAQVAQHIYQRTTDKYGNELGTFTTATRPTAIEAGALCEQAARDVVAFVGTTIPSRVLEQARDAAALRAAALVESSFYPRARAQGESAYGDLTAQYLAAAQAVADEARGGPRIY